MTFKGGVRIFRCAETAQGVARCVEVPEWMFDRATCCGMAYAESPRVGCAALDRLKVLILECPYRKVKTADRDRESADTRCR
jgi:hypothetical protein